MPRLSAAPGRPAATDLAARVRAERERLGLSQSEAARRMGLTRLGYRRHEVETALSYPVLLGLIDLGMDPHALAPELFAPVEPAAAGA